MTSKLRTNAIIALKEIQDIKGPYHFTKRAYFSHVAQFMVINMATYLDEDFKTDVGQLFKQEGMYLPTSIMHFNMFSKAKHFTLDYELALLAMPRYYPPILKFIKTLVDDHSYMCAQFLAQFLAILSRTSLRQPYIKLVCDIQKDRVLNSLLKNYFTTETKVALSRNHLITCIDKLVSSSDLSESSILNSPSHFQVPTLSPSNLTFTNTTERKELLALVNEELERSFCGYHLGAYSKEVASNLAYNMIAYVEGNNLVPLKQERLPIAFTYHARTLLGLARALTNVNTYKAIELFRVIYTKCVEHGQANSRGGLYLLVANDVTLLKILNEDTSQSVDFLLNISSDVVDCNELLNTLANEVSHG